MPSRVAAATKRPIHRIATYLVSAMVACTALRAQEPHWIWATDPALAEQSAQFVRHFRVDARVRSASLTMTCDNRFEVWLDGVRIAGGDEWQQPQHVDVTDAMQASATHVLAVRARNDGGPAGLCGMLRVLAVDGSHITLATDARWLVHDDAPDGWQARDAVAPSVGIDGWRAAVDFGPVSRPRGPWPDPFASSQATRAETLTIADGFTVELLRSAQPGEGSWVALAFDARGRLLVSPQYGGLLRVTLPDRVERLTLDPPLRGAQGLCFVDDELFVVVNGSIDEDGGLWRLRDSDGDDQFDDIARLASFGPGGEHGGHGIVLGGDGLLYMVHGNMTSLLPIAPDSPHTNWAEDVLLPREVDPRGHAVEVEAPGGRVWRTDREGSRFELIAAGMRNAYDLAFDSHGNLFTFDSDMEWDRGLPWYRPTRVLQIVGGGEYGWRTGSAKWPAHYLDSLGSVVDVGEGSPTGIEFGTRSHFGAHYRDALFLADWARGRILAAFVEGAGAGFTAAIEPFVSGLPLNVTDLTFGPDGALYFVTGGRRTQSGLYRVRAKAPAPLDAAGAELARPRLLDVDARGLDDLWEGLGATDRVERYRARIALERLPVALWRERALAETDPRRAIAALLGLIRSGAATDRDAALLRVLHFAPAAPSESLLEVARTVAVGFARGAVRTDAMRDAVLAAFDARFPCGDFVVDRELAELLAFVDAPDFVARAVARMQQGASPAEQLWFAHVVRDRPGEEWDEATSRRFWRWLAEARSLRGGESLQGYLRAIERRARARLPAELRAVADRYVAPPPPDATPAATAPAQLAATGIEWSFAELREQLATGNDATTKTTAGIAAGEQTFVLRCAACHAAGGVRGGGIGPDLTDVASRFGRDDLLRAILDPSEEVSDQYANTTLTLRNGDAVVGRVTAQDADSLEVCIDSLADRRIRIARADIVTREISKVSTMPPGLLTGLSAAEVRALFEFLAVR